MRKIDTIAIASLPFSPPLIRDFIQGEENINHLFSLAPNLASIPAAIAQRKLAKTDRNTLVAVLNSQYQNIDLNDLAKKNIELLAAETTFTFTAAHQPCLFLGPVYNLVKISAAIVAATEAKKAYPTFDFVPIFWLGSEDHDKEELCNTFVGEDKINWATANEGAIGKFSNDGLLGALQLLKEKTSIESHPIFDLISQKVATTANFGELTQGLVHEIFKDFGLVVLDQNEKTFKEAFIPIIKDELKNNRAEKVLSKSNDWLSKNYHVQVSPRPINFFKLENQSRIRIERNVEGIFSTNEKTFSDISSFDALIDNTPEIFSPNVVFRPLLQELILPNICFVGGAGELSYWLQLKPLFDYYQIPYPMLAHRPMVATISKSQVEKMRKLNLSFLDFVEEENSIIKKWILENATTEITADIEKNQIELAYQRLLNKMVKVDKSLEGAANAELQKTLNSIDNLLNKMVKAEKRNQETSVSQIQQIKKTLFPIGTLWERHENSLSFLLRLSENEFWDFVLMQNPFEKNLYFLEI